MLEYEKKLLLTDQEYTALLKLRDIKNASTTHVNYYYDSDDFRMNEQGVTCRIREQNGKYKATIKTRKEKNKECSVIKTIDALNEYDDSMFSGMHLKLQGCLKTVRIIVYSDEKCKVVLDKNTYLGVADYEMEVKYLPECEEHATNQIYRQIRFLYPLKLCMMIIPYRSFKSKTERFFEQKQKLSSERKRR